MFRKLLGDESGQALIEYGLIAVVFVLVAVSGLTSLGPSFVERVGGIAQAFNLPGQAESVSTGFLSIKDDFLARIQSFYDKNGQWPRTWGDYRFADLGLDAKNWKMPVEGISWNPHGEEIGLANVEGDNLQIYVNNLKGERLHLFDGWNIWCRGGSCYFHDVAKGNEVDIKTLVVVKETKVSATSDSVH
jgi:Flp pilus assembly pilin Flp